MLIYVDLWRVVVYYILLSGFILFLLEYVGILYIYIYIYIYIWGAGLDLVRKYVDVVRKYVDIVKKICLDLVRKYVDLVGKYVKGVRYKKRRT